MLACLGGLLDRCVFGVSPGCLEHWLTDGKDFFSCFMTEEIFPGFSFASAAQKVRLLGVATPTEPERLLL